MAGEYNASSIQKITLRESIRRRSGMYIGSTDQRGLHHMIYEIVNNSVDEVVAGYANRIAVTIRSDGAIAVCDNGRGIPVDPDPETQQPFLEFVMAKRHHGHAHKLSSYHYKTSGLWGVGAVVVNSLSVWARVEVRRDGQVYAQEYREGNPIGPVAATGADPEGRGTTTLFKPDPTIFETTDYDYVTLAERFCEICCLTRGLTITFVDQRADQERQDTFYFEHGICAWVEHLNREHTPLHEAFYVEATVEHTAIEVALQYNSTAAAQILSYVNGWGTVDGGTERAGFQAALTSTLNTYAHEHGILKGDEYNLIGSDLQAGLTAIVSVMLTNPLFVTALHNQLGNPEVRGQVQQVVGPALRQFLEENPEAAQAIIEHCLEAARARMAHKRRRRPTG